MRQFIVPLLALTALSSSAVAAQTYDVVIRHVRAMDPETGLDAERTIGISGGRIAAIGTAPLTGRTIIDGGGLVASPGFIDLHSHAYSYDTAGYQAMDGVTTRLELEIGVFPVKDWFAFKKGHELINYGATVSHTYARQYLQEEAAGKPHIMDQSSAAHRINGDPALIRAPVPDAFYPRLLPLLEEGLKEGALGVGSCVHIVHINSMAMSSTPAMISLMHDARAHGIDISTEMYPWDASVDQVRSVIFDPGWERRWGVTPHDLQSRATGKRLTQMEFDALRSGTGDDGVLMHMNSEATLETAMKDPLVLFASDSMDIVDDNSHPRSAGNFAHVLGHYVRETKTLALMEALRKMTLQPAQRLETFAPAMKRKGRLQVGADADIDIFDPATVQAGAGYQHAKRYSSGMRWVLVNGRFVVRDGKLVTGVYPGEPVYGGAKR
ncbi:MAG: amidohydrolase family protein [Sphingomonas sp.]|nr:amidohydrolase family protein [Sphingomonas sp.]